MYRLHPHPPPPPRPLTPLVRPKVRVYLDEEGRPKGDGLVTFLRVRPLPPPPSPP